MDFGIVEYLISECPSVPAKLENIKGIVGYLPHPIAYPTDVGLVEKKGFNRNLLAPQLLN